MKKTLGSIVTIFLILGISSMVHAYSYTSNFQSGGVSLHVAENCSLLSITTTDDLVVDLGLEVTPEGKLMKYTASADLTLGLFGVINYSLALNDLALGNAQSFNPSGLLGDGTGIMNFAGTGSVSAAFGQYALTDATLDYDITFTPSQTVADRYAIDIATLSLSGGNTSELLSGFINELNQSGQSPIALTAPFTIPTTITGAFDIQADPVPVPAAIWLLGSGLLGLAGFKRKKA